MAGDDATESKINIGGHWITNSWPTFSDDELSGLSPEVRTFVEADRRQMIQVTTDQLNEINLGCRSKPQYAKTYRALRRDQRASIEKMRAKHESLVRQIEAARANGSLTPEDEPAVAMMGATLRMNERILSSKLTAMESHFLATWGERIENWSGKEGDAIDKSGCLVFVAAAIAVGVGAYRWLA